MKLSDKDPTILLRKNKKNASFASQEYSPGQNNSSEAKDKKNISFAKENKLRLQVFLSRNGISSRRRAMDIVKEGRVTLNGQVCREPSTPVDPTRDHITVDKKTIHGKTFEYIVLNKPKGFTTTKADRFAAKTILDLLPKKFQHLSPVGRLDKDTEGLLLLTNDGDCAYRLTHPKFNVDKTYVVRIKGALDNEQKKRLERGVIVDRRKTASSKISHVKSIKDQTEMLIVIHEGRKRQVRMMFAKVGHKVIYLKRIKQGPLNLGTLKKGTWRPLNKQEIANIKKI